MKIEMSFNPEILQNYAKRGASVLFNIYWKHEDIAYPGDDWLDFGTVILGWWLRNISFLLESGEIESFAFMDGPYEIECKFEGLNNVQLIPKGTYYLWDISVEALAREIVRAANEATRQLRNYNIAEKECQILDEGISKVRAILKTRKS